MAILDDLEATGEGLALWDELTAAVTTTRRTQMIPSNGIDSLCTPGAPFFVEPAWPRVGLAVVDNALVVVGQRHPLVWRTDFSPPTARSRQAAGQDQLIRLPDAAIGM
jgi:hypothetical protein